MPINDHYVWLIWASAFLIPWLAIYAGLPRFRTQMLKASLWTSLLGLDESLTYSCAYFRNASDPLEQAQRQKIEHSLKKLRLQTGETLLDIGCGWGALVMRASEHYHANATGIALSKDQHAEANMAIKKRGLEGAAG